MKLYLFGGAESSLGQVPILRTLIKEIILKFQPKCILHVPFARTNLTDPFWPVGWFTEMLQDTNIIVYDAQNKDDVKSATDPLIFINGGLDKANLMDAINRNSELKDKVLNAQYIIADSAGALILCEWFRSSR